MKLFLLFTVLSFASALLVSVTCFTRIVIVLGFFRQALGTPQLPPNQVLIGLSLMLSFFVIGPTADRVWGEALGPYLDDRMPPAVALEKASAPVREFMLRQTREQDLQLFYEISHRPRPARGDEIPMTVAMPAFMVFSGRGAPQWRLRARGRGAPGARTVAPRHPPSSPHQCAEHVLHADREALRALRRGRVERPDGASESSTPTTSCSEPLASPKCFRRIGPLSLGSPSHRLRNTDFAARVA